MELDSIPHLENVGELGGMGCLVSVFVCSLVIFFHIFGYGGEFVFKD